MQNKYSEIIKFNDREFRYNYETYRIEYISTTGIRDYECDGYLTARTVKLVDPDVLEYLVWPQWTWEISKLQSVQFFSGLIDEMIKE